jgi:hypothetical protein
MEKICATYEVPVPQGRLALKAALQASLGSFRDRDAEFPRLQMS